MHITSFNPHTNPARQDRTRIVSPIYKRGNLRPGWHRCNDSSRATQLAGGHAGLSPAIYMLALRASKYHCFLKVCRHFLGPFLGERGVFTHSANFLTPVHSYC